mmetsp:Transcript_83678/g.269665  ORF Transcript_83678/g.269665 Transcript_83678/m.269665 type:complete len:117 (-) Transcript_83678:34-384(-)
MPPRSPSLEVQDKRKHQRQGDATKTLNESGGPSCIQGHRSLYSKTKSAAIPSEVVFPRLLAMLAQNMVSLRVAIHSWSSGILSTASMAALIFGQPWKAALAPSALSWKPPGEAKNI